MRKTSRSRKNQRMVKTEITIITKMIESEILPNLIDAFNQVNNVINAEFESSKLTKHIMNLIFERAASIFIDSKKPSLKNILLKTLKHDYKYYYDEYHDEEGEYDDEDDDDEEEEDEEDI